MKTTMDTQIAIPTMEKIMALSWKQPFGTAMLHGKIETRMWDTSYRGYVLICTSQKAYTLASAIDICGGSDRFADLMDVVKDDQTFSLYGMAIAVGKLVDTWPMRRIDEEKTFVKYYSDLFCHQYEDVRRIEPFRWHGIQKWKAVTDAERSKIKFIQ